MSPISGFAQSSDHFELYHDSQSSGFGNAIHDLKLASRGETDGLWGQPSQLRLPTTSR